MRIQFIQWTLSARIPAPRCSAPARLPTELRSHRGPNLTMCTISYPLLSASSPA